MNLDEAILHCLEQADKQCNECGKEHYQLALWLKELKEFRKLADENKLIYEYIYEESRVCKEKN